MILSIRTEIFCFELLGKSLLCYAEISSSQGLWGALSLAPTLLCSLKSYVVFMVFLFNMKLSILFVSLSIPTPYSLLSSLNDCVSKPDNQACHRCFSELRINMCWVRFWASLLRIKYLNFLWYADYMTFIN